MFHNVYEGLNIDNKLFENTNVVIGDDLLKPFHKLAIAANNKSIEVGTHARIKKEEANAIVFIDHPLMDDPIFKYAEAADIPRYLLILESPIVNKQNFTPSLHTSFKKIFTWSDDQVAVDKARYIKINYAFDIALPVSEGVRQKNCVVIAGNKVSNAENELYSERMRCIKWYDKHAPSELDLYGMQWNLRMFDNEKMYGAFINKINRRLKWLKHNFSIYKGSVARKRDVLSLYNFNLCLENVHGFRGYITEKIFDSLFAGTIPIYKGAENIKEYIPESCFIDYDSFGSFKELRTYLSSMKDHEIIGYQKAIKAYLSGNTVKQFSIDSFVETILDNIHITS
jgi:hypothetical protein